MLKNVQKDKKGFTIIEVMIVLAIAGLIILIVLLAVPQLQRNSRNTGRKSDITRIAAGVNEFASNNNGAMPAEGNMAAIITQTGNLGQYVAADRVANATLAQGVLGNTANQPRFRLVTNAVCGAGGVTTAGSPRQAALQYQLETNNGAVHNNVCVDV
jgi:prepilin-type N-terminal cleavage/methylation domain-containing protein